MSWRVEPQLIYFTTVLVQLVLFHPSFKYTTALNYTLYYRVVSPEFMSRQNIKRVILDKPNATHLIIVSEIHMQNLFIKLLMQYIGLICLINKSCQLEFDDPFKLY